MTSSIQGSTRQENPAFTPCEQAALIVALITTLALAAISGMASFNGMSSHYLGGVVSANALFGFAAPAAIVLFVFFCIKSCSHNSLEETSEETKPVSEKDSTASHAPTPSSQGLDSLLLESEMRSEATDKPEMASSRSLGNLYIECKNFLERSYQPKLSAMKQHFKELINEHLGEPLAENEGKPLSILKHKMVNALRFIHIKSLKMKEEKCEKIIRHRFSQPLAMIQQESMYMLLDLSLPRIDIPKSENPSLESLLEAIEKGTQRMKRHEEAFIKSLEKTLQQINQLESYVEKEFEDILLSNITPELSSSDKQKMVQVIRTEMEMESEELVTEIHSIIACLNERIIKAEIDMNAQVASLEKALMHHDRDSSALKTRILLELNPLNKKTRDKFLSLSNEAMQIQEMTNLSSKDLESFVDAKEKEISSFVEAQNAFLDAQEERLDKEISLLRSRTKNNLHPSLHPALRAFADSEFERSCSEFEEEMRSMIVDSTALIIEEDMALGEILAVVRE